MAGRGSYRSRQRKRLSRFYLLVALGLILVFVKWGFPLLIKLIAKTGGDNKNQVEELSDVVPPQTPVMSALPEATNSAVLKIEGYTEAGVEVEYYINSKRVIVEQADNNGFYQANLDLEEGDNLIKVVARDEAKNESVSKPVKVIYDFKTPEIKVTSPTEGQEFFGRQKQTISVYGELSEPNATLKINDAYVGLDNVGLFDQQVKLDEGENKIKLMAVDAAGNVSEKTIKVTYVR